MDINLNDLIGKPFHEDGYGTENYSCYGLAVEVFKRYGIDIPRTNISVCACKETSQKVIKETLLKMWEPATEIIAPTGIVIRSANPDFADHLAVYIGEGKMIHITMNTNVTIERIHKWEHRIIGYFKYVG